MWGRHVIPVASPLSACLPHLPAAALNDKSDSPAFSGCLRPQEQH